VTSSMHTAIATIFDGSELYTCALPLWCQQATHLAALMGNSTVVVVTRNASADCPTAQMRWGSAASRAMRAAMMYLRRHEVLGGWRKLGWAVLLKISVMALTDFDLILFADLDVDVRPGSFSIAEWRSSTRSFLQSRAEFVGTSDHESPVNTGLWLAKPSTSAFHEGLALLRTTWTAARGVL